MVQKLQTFRGCDLHAASSNACLITFYQDLLTIFSKDRMNSAIVYHLVFALYIYFHTSNVVVYFFANVQFTRGFIMMDVYTYTKRRVARVKSAELQIPFIKFIRGGAFP